MDDAEAIKQRVRDQYDEMAERWHRWTPVMSAQYAPATQLMLDLAHLRPGDHVLDVAAGDGYQSIAAARRVGPTGHVLAVDIARAQLRYAAAAARDMGVEHLETRVMDAENLDLPDGVIDAVLCQFGLMFFPDVDRGLREMLRVLKPRAWASLVIYATRGAPDSELAESIIRSHLGSHAPASIRGWPAELGAPGALERRLEAAGFRTVEAHELLVPFRLPSAEEAVAYIRDLHPSLTRLLAPLAADERDAVWRDVEAGLKAFVGTKGYECPNRIIVAAGARPT